MRGFREHFHSHGWQLCKFIGTNESVCIRKDELPKDPELPQDPVFERANS